MSKSESFLRQFHAAHPGITSRVFARESYERLAARVAGKRVLDLGCGNAPLGIGIDLSLHELRGTPNVAQGRAQQLPFADGAFDAAVSHLAFPLFDEPERVVAELARCVRGPFHAVLGGGPTVDPDAFHRFLDLAKPRGEALGDPRAKTEVGWRTLFAGWNITFERFVVDLSGPFDEVYAFFASTYQTFDDCRAQLATEYGDAMPCRVVMWLATATR